LTRPIPDPPARAHGAVFQAGALFNSMTVYDNLALYPASTARTETQIRDA